MYKKDISISRRKKVNSPLDVMLEESLMIFKYQPCEIFEGL